MWFRQIQVEFAHTLGRAIFFPLPQFVSERLIISRLLILQHFQVNQIVVPHLTHDAMKQPKREKNNGDCLVVPSFLGGASDIRHLYDCGVFPTIVGCYPP